MTRIFISHSHSDEAIAYKLFDFLMSALKLEDDDLLCTSDPNSGLSFNSNSISDQLKTNLKGAEALVALITTDSLRSLWIPFEIGSFWPTEKPIVLILGPGLTPSNLPGPLKGWLSIRTEDDLAFEQLNEVTNQLEKKLDIRQNVNRSRRDRHLNEFLTQFKAWKSKLPESDVSQQKEIEELTVKLQETKLSHTLQLEEIKAASSQQRKELEENYQRQKQELEQSFQSKISQLEQQLAQKVESFSRQQTNLQAAQEKIAEKEAIIAQLQEQLKSDSKITARDEVKLKTEKGVDYTKLRDFLAAEEWKEADLETFKVMLKVADREQQGWLDTDSIDNFPCEDLRTINQLWLHYSKEKFGFSVQKEIYEDLGGTREYNEEVLENFGDRVGWRK